jgi:hypothetical protein
MGIRFASEYCDRDEAAYIRHSGLVGETNTEKIFNIGGAKVWLPAQYITTYDREYVAIPRWLAKAKKLSTEW